MYSASLSTPWIIADEREKMSMAHQNHVTQIAVGESLRSRLREALRGSFVNESIRKASNIDPGCAMSKPGSRDRRRQGRRVRRRELPRSIQKL